MPAGESERGPGPEPLPFSVVLAPTATVDLTGVGFDTHGGPGQMGGVCFRHICCAWKTQQHGNDRDHMGSKYPPSRITSTVMVVRSQTHALHVFRGRKLCKVVEFPSPVVDVAGFPGGPSSAAASGSDTLCMALCRDGTVYALPVTEILGAAERTAHKSISEQKRTTGSIESGGRNSGSGADAAGPGEGEGAGKTSSRQPSTPVEVGIFDELAPTILEESQGPLPKKLAATQQVVDSTMAGVEGGVVLGGLVIKVKARWARFSHLGARTVVACIDRKTTAVAGIIDCAASYHIMAEGNISNGESQTTMSAGRLVGALVGVDGASPTSSCSVWVDDDGSCHSALGDGKGFPLPSPLFRSLFGAELSRWAAHSKSNTTPSEDDVATKVSVVLVGDAEGTVRWSPVHPSTGVSGGALASLPGETTAIVAMLPQLDADSRVVGVLLVGANGTVLSLGATEGITGSCRGKASRKRSRPGSAEEDRGHEDGGNSAGSGERRTGAGSSTAELRPPAASVTTEAPPQSISRRVIRLPFPVASACSAPGFLLHCYGGALFATALSVAREGHDQMSGLPSHLPDRFMRSNACHVADPVISLRSVRLPLPCDTVGVAVARVLASEDERARDATSANLSPARASPPAQRTLVVSLSAGGRLVGFMAPQSVEELEGWTLATGRGGVRVGGSAGVERRLRWQLERLSSLRGQCTALADESAERDREIRILRGAAVLLPPLTATASHRDWNRSNCGGISSSSGSLAHSISMTPDMQDGGVGCADSYGGGTSAEQNDTLRVRLCVRLWPREGGYARKELQAVGGEECNGRWFIVTRLLAEGDGEGDSVNNSNASSAPREGWAWSTSAVVPMGTLCQGWPWSSSLALTLPSARPVTASSWLQFRFKADAGESESTITGAVGEGPCSKAAGVCVELGRARFDVLDWGVKLSSVPRGAAAVRAASRGRGLSFSGPETAIADVFGGSSSLADDGCGRRGNSAHSAAASQTPVPVAWSNFSLRVESPDQDADSLLRLLVPAPNLPPPIPPGDKGGGSRANGACLQSEIAIRVAGQVAIIQATAAAAERREKKTGGWTDGARPPKLVELAVTCSHAAMTPLVREALLRRTRALVVVPPGDGRELGIDGESGGEAIGGKAPGGCSREVLIAQGDAAARLARDVHSVRQAVIDAGDEVRALGAARSSDGPSAESSKEALALMYKIGGIYQSLRRQQEGFGSM